MTRTKAIASAVQQLVDTRPGRELVDFQVMSSGSPTEPWSAYREGFGWKSEIPCGLVYKNWKWAKGTNNFPLLPDTCDRAFGLGSGYAFIDCETDEILHIGMAGHNSLEGRVYHHLKHRGGVPRILRDESGRRVAYRFEGHEWQDRPRSITIAQGAFYVVFVVNMKPFSAFPNPCRADRTHLKSPYILIGEDLETHLARTFGLPPLNRQDVARRNVDFTKPWGSPR